MAIVIPPSVFDKFNEAVTLFNKTCTLVYPAKREQCTNCTSSSFGGRSTSVYRVGGPQSFAYGEICPLCDGEGFKSVETTEDVEMRVYWDTRHWLKIDASVDVPDGSIQTIGLMTDFPKINKADHIIPQDGSIQNHQTLKFRKIGESYPQGFKQNTVQYVVNFWERTG